ncbi:PocR ligand-binding domain-containing protein [Acetobacterium malicum]|nr:PocR ligand-binding domain-containing protein [Acetobacterium malicum]
MSSEPDRQSQQLHQPSDAALTPAPLIPDGAGAELALADIIDVPAVQSLLESFQQLTGMLAAIVDRNGTVLVQVGWQDICTMFHRCHPETLKNCVESDTVLDQATAPGTFFSYRCKNGLWDISTPIVVSGQHLGNIYFGQFIYADETLDLDRFRQQARRYGFVEADYLAALDRVPRYDRETVEQVMTFYAKLGAMISALSFGNLRMAQILTRHQAMEAQLYREQEAIKHLSFHDHLTGLYNRRFYEEELTRLDTERNWPLTIVLGDVNGLKLINDSFGHRTGDRLLQKTAAALTRGCRADDIIARMGGDEFVVLFPQTDAVEAARLIKRIKKILANERIEGLEISVSFGSETKTSAADDIQEVFRTAEDAMYHNKLYEGPSLKGRVIDSIIAVLNQKSSREEAHSRQVSELCQKMGEALALEDYQIKELKAFGLLHDIGKIAIADKILNKSGPLTDYEWIEIKNHAEIGYRILSTNKDMTEIATYVLAHHERWDGTGYPKGLKGLEISLPARICAIADAYDAMTSERSYKSTLSEAEVRTELQKNAGTQFDPDLVQLFIEQL